MTPGYTLDLEVGSALRRAAHEIRELRAANQRQAEQLRIVAIFERALYGNPPAQEYGEDIAWRLEKLAAELQSIAPADAIGLTDGPPPMGRARPLPA